MLLLCYLRSFRITIYKNTTKDKAVEESDRSKILLKSSEYAPAEWNDCSWS